VKLSHVMEELVEERGLDRTVLSAIVCEGLQVVYSKKYPDVSFLVEYDKKADEIRILANKLVVGSVANEFQEVSLRKARGLQEGVQIGDTIKVPFEEPIGRIEILRAKQIIAQQIRTIEAEAIYKEFKPKEGTIVVGTIYKTEMHGVSVKVEDTLAFLPKSLMNPGDVCTSGYTMRFMLKEVLAEPRNDNQLILDRKSPEFLAGLFRLEIPEVYENIVEIKKIVRIAGYKSKILVSSHEKNVDPVGTCIGFGGARIKPILRELGTEKVDIINADYSTEDLIKNALKPAVVRRVLLVGDKMAEVWLDADQRSIAIGKMGQNVSLAAELCGVEIQLMDDASPQAVLSNVISQEEGQKKLAAENDNGGE